MERQFGDREAVKEKYEESCGGEGVGERALGEKERAGDKKRKRKTGEREK